MKDLFKMIVIMLFAFLSSCDGEEKTHEQQTNALLDRVRKELKDEHLSEKELSSLHEEISSQRESNIAKMQEIADDIKDLDGAVTDIDLGRRSGLKSSLTRLEEKNSQLNKHLVEIEGRSPGEIEEQDDLLWVFQAVLILSMLLLIVVSFLIFSPFHKGVTKSTSRNQKPKGPSDLQLILGQAKSWIQNIWNSFRNWVSNLWSRTKSSTPPPSAGSRKKASPPKPSKGPGIFAKLWIWIQVKRLALKSWLNGSTQGGGKWLSRLLWILFLLVLLYAGYCFRDELCRGWRSAVEWVDEWWNNEDEEEYVPEETVAEEEKVIPEPEPIPIDTIPIPPPPIEEKKIPERKKVPRKKAPREQKKQKTVPPKKKYPLPTRTRPRDQKADRGETRGYYPPGTSKNVKDLTHEVR